MHQIERTYRSPFGRPLSKFIRFFGRFAATSYRLDRIRAESVPHGGSIPCANVHPFNSTKFATFGRPLLWRLPVTRKILTLFACIFAVTLAIHAQSNYAVVRGSILDPQHRPVAGAQVHAVTRDTGAARAVVSNEAGLY